MLRSGRTNRCTCAHRVTLVSATLANFQAHRFGALPREAVRRRGNILSTMRPISPHPSAFALLALLTGAFSQITAQTEPRFEVASIKPSPPDAGGTTVYNSTRERFAADSITTRTLIALAWDVRVFQVSGGPGWLDSQRYDVVAKPEGDAAVERIRRMVRTFLADRFQLQVHHTSKEMPVFTLEVAKGGSKVRAASPGDGPDIRGPKGHLTTKRITAEMLARILANEWRGRLSIAPVSKAPSMQTLNGHPIKMSTPDLQSLLQFRNSLD
jgi:hypothetical protein